jgi:outer membrane protein TolC
MRTLTQIRTLAMVLALSLAPQAIDVAMAEEHVLTLREAIDMAVRKNEGLRIERSSLGAARATVMAAKGAYDPRLELDGGWQRSTEPVNSSFSGAPVGQAGAEIEASEGGAAVRQLLPTGGALSLRTRGSKESTNGSLALLSPAFGTQAGVELRQPLLRDFSTDEARTSVRVANADREAAVASLRRATTETVAATEQAYWQLVAARLAARVREEAVTLAEQQLKETESRTQTGSTPRTELAQPRAELERRRGDLFAARESIARAENALKLLILDGADDALWPHSLAPDEDAAVEVVPADVAGSLNRAFSTRPELAVAQAAVKHRHAETAFARNGVWPSLDAVVSYDRFGIAGSRNPASASGSLPTGLQGDLGQSFESLRSGDFDATRVSLVLGLPIINRTARGNAAVARHLEQQAETDVARVRKLIRAEVLNAAAALQTAGQRIEATRSGREAAEVQLSAERDRFATGLSTNFLVLTRQNDLSRARLDEISALTDYRAARTEMARASGALLDEHEIEIGRTDR